MTGFLSRLTLPRVSFVLAGVSVPFLGWTAVCVTGLAAGLYAYEVYRATGVSSVAELEKRMAELRADHAKLANALGVRTKAG